MSPEPKRKRWHCSVEFLASSKEMDELTDRIADLLVAADPDPDSWDLEAHAWDRSCISHPKKAKR